MRKKKSNFLIFSILFVILTLTLFVDTENFRLNPKQQNEVMNIKVSTTSSYSAHDPIVIASDADFISQGWPGYGNETHPYLIENLEITSDDVCIQISWTTAWFVIDNCNLTMDTYSGSFGVCLVSLEHAAVYNCKVSRMDYGIYCEDVQNTVIINNTMSHTIYSGVDIRDSLSVSAVNNTGHIDISSSTNCLIDQNQGGVRLMGSQDCNITNSDFGHDWSGLYLSGTNIKDYLHYISGNTVFGYPVVYMSNISDLVINPTGYGQLVLVNCTGTQVLDGIAPAVGPISWIFMAFCNQCSIKNNLAEGFIIGAEIVDCQNTLLEGNVFSGSIQTGMHIGNSHNCTIIHNQFYDSNGAVYIWGSDANVSYNLIDTCSSGLDIDHNSTIIGNRIFDCETHGLEVDGDWNTIKDNLISNTSQSDNPSYASTGITLWGSNNYLENNTIMNTRNIGIRIEGMNCTFIDNKLTGKGITLSGATFWHWMHTMSGNTLDGQPLQYISNQNDIEFDASESSQLILVNCTSVMVVNGVFEETLSLGFCDQVVLENNNVSNAVVGFWLVNLTKSSIRGNNAIANQAAGFIMRYLENCTIEYNCATLHVYDGIGFGLQDSADCTVSFNVATYNQGGIYLYGVSEFTMESNVASHNEQFGIVLTSCDNGTLCDNEIIYNEQYGIFVQSSTEIVLYDNEIGYNTIGNAREDGSSNQWDNGVDIGNAWSDYSGSGTYLISGSAGSEDRYPTLLNYAPALVQIMNIEYEAGSTGHLLNWTAFDMNPNSYVTYIDSAIVDSGDWIGPFIIIDVDGLVYGTHNITLFVNDTVGAFSVGSVFVTVVDTTDPTIDGPENSSWAAEDTGNEISWIVYDFSPAYVSISIDGVFFELKQWNTSGETITVNLDHLTAGVHNITILAVDLAGNSAADSVTVTVLEATASTSTTTTSTGNTMIPTEVLILGVVSTGVVLIIVLIIVRSKRT